jgi:preprotein translocase subunit SecA
MRELVTTQLSHVMLQPRPVAPPAPDFTRIRETHIDPLTGENDADGGDTIADSLGAVGSDPSLRPIDPKLLVGVSRNAPCPCGSGKKFKHCHGAF